MLGSWSVRVCTERSRCRCSPSRRSRPSRGRPDAVYVESEDVLHSVFAGIIGFGFIVGVVAVMVARRLPTTRAALPDIAAIIIPSAVSLTMSTSIWGLLQRTMFLTAAAWYTRESVLSGRAIPGNE